MEYQSLSFWIAGIAIAAYLFHKWITKNHNYFKDRGIPYKKPFLFLGSNSSFWYSKKSFAEFFSSLYSEFDGARYIIINFKMYKT